jgi:NAD(P)-dependent dehydrogenase (short-subunit alcohol dehydrogenase family)
MATVVITGSTQGFGAGLARAFLARSFNVVVCSRRPAPERVATEISDSPERVLVAALDVAQPGAADELWRQATARFGSVEIWINNAGLAYGGPPLAHADPVMLQQMVSTNVLGTLLGCRAAVAGMAAQTGGAIYNIYGAGSDGHYVPAMVAYGTTKSAVDYLTRALAAETLSAGIIVGGISPGLLMTEPVLRSLRGLSGAQLASRLKIVSIIGDDVNVVAQWAVEKILGNVRTGQVFVRLTRARMLGRRVRALWRPRDVVSKHGISV